ncbi:MAG TPA: competence/damage-inducible protein A [Phycisphaerae bacterium]|nr:competence/damage-inducible protein A [Phycisphaerae bacterium]
MNAQIISIGTELALGQTVDTNTAWLAQKLAAVGVACAKHVTIDDQQAAIEQAIRTAANETELVLVTGGLGPTPDDVTRQAVAAAMDVQLRFDEQSFKYIEEYFRARKRAMHPENRTQAMFPDGAKPIRNHFGTAPGFHAVVGLTDIYVMPGVPREMKMMFEQYVLPFIEEAAAGETIVQRTLHTFGMPEAEVGEKIADLMERGRNPAVGTSAADLIISIRVNAQGATHDEAARLADVDVFELISRLGNVVYGEGDETLADAVAKLLIDQKKTISTAESCTGGLIAKMLTDVSGSSAYFTQSFITYANESKHRLLGIPAELIGQHGAVSAAVAEVMAQKCREISDTYYALSATGVAGPTGGTPEKPVGLVYITLATLANVVVKELRLGEILTRSEIRDRTAKCALNLLRLELLKNIQR